MGEIMLVIKNMSIRFENEILNNASFTCRKGEIVAISGPSGSGKTSLIKFIIGDLKNQSGTILYNNVCINDNNRHNFLFNVVTYIDQFSSYYPNMNIKEHFTFYAKLHNTKISDADIKGYLNKVKLNHISIKKSPSKLSTGERKRFLIALALMLKKEIIIMDEPTASLDQKNTSLLMKLIEELSLEGISFVISTHSHDVLNIAHTVYTIDNKILLKEETKDYKNIQEINRQLKKPKRIIYSRYKNLRIRILFIFILFIGGLSISYVSHIISQTVCYKESINNIIDNYQMNKLYLVKTTDERVDFHNHLALYDYYGLDTMDVLGADEIEQIKRIDGINDVKYALTLMNVSTITTFGNDESKRYIQIYKNDELLEKKELIQKDGNEATVPIIYLLGYYPEDHFPKDGIYIDETLNSILNLDSYEGIEIEFDVRIFHDFKYDTIDTPEISHVNGIVSENDVVKFKIPVDGYISDDEYRDQRFAEDCGVIYVPIETLKQVVNNYGFNLSEKDFEFMHRQSILYCDSDKIEDIKLTIEEMSERYYVTSPYLTKLNQVKMFESMSGSSSIMNWIISLLLIVSESLLVVYYVYLRKQEFVLLKRDGLENKIMSYFRWDDVLMSITWLIISLCLFLLAKKVAAVSTFISGGFYFLSWCSVTVVFIIAIIITKTCALNYIRKKMIP